MEAFLNKELEYSWRPSCTHSAEETGCVSHSSRVSCQTSRHIDVCIDFNESCVENLYPTILEQLEIMSKKDDMKVGHGRIQRIMSREVKPEYEEIHNLLIKQNQELNELIEKTSGKLRNANHNIEKANLLRPIPEEWFQPQEKELYGLITISCHVDSEFYKFAVNNNLLANVISL